MGRNVLKTSIALRSLVRHGQTDTNFEIPTFLSQTVVRHTEKSQRSVKHIAILVPAVAKSFHANADGLKKKKYAKNFHLEKLQQRWMLTLCFNRAQGGHSN